jgi:hypothetical protein
LIEECRIPLSAHRSGPTDKIIRWSLSAQVSLLRPWGGTLRRSAHHENGRKEFPMEATMPSDALDTPRWSRWAGGSMTALFVLFMVFDTSIKLMGLQIVDDTLSQLGYPAGLGFAIGVLELVLLVLYLIPRTAILGVVLFTGLFGGTMATHLRAGSPVFSHVLFGLYLGALAWGGLWLRDARLRALFPVRR